MRAWIRTTGEEAGSCEVCVDLCQILLTKELHAELGFRGQILL